MFKRFNICTKKTYLDSKTGQDKNQWLRVGNLIYFPANGDKEEGYRLELYMFPGTPFSIFPDKPKDGAEAEVDIQTGRMTAPRANKQLTPVVPKGSKLEPGQIEYPDEINPADIPF